MRQAISFDAAGTLIRLTKSVGQHYAQVGEELDLALDPTALDQAFRAIWPAMPLRPATGLPRPDDDKGWWRVLVERVLDRIEAPMTPAQRATFFEAAYAHFAAAGVWELYPEVREVLAALGLRYPLIVISNFDQRLRMVFDHLEVSSCFRHVFLSSELGADKPDPLIYRRAAELSGFAPNEILHAGDDPKRDWAAAQTGGLEVFELKRPENSLRELLEL